jgi:hypothetical protein
MRNTNCSTTLYTFNIKKITKKIIDPPNVNRFQVLNPYDLKVPDASGIEKRKKYENPPTIRFEKIIILVP